MSCVLVTGAAGFIGSHVTDDLLKIGHEVVALDDLSGGFEDNVPARARFIRGSILDTDLIKDIFTRNKIDYVFHLAAYAAEGLSHFIKRFNYNNNLIGSVNLINASINHGVRCFVFTSSIAVYGHNQLPMNEELQPTPEDPYGVAKYAVEQELRASHAMFGLEYVIFRPHNVYGERQNIGDRYRNVIGIFMNQIMRGEALTIFGDGSQTRAFSYISEVSPLIAKSVQVAAARNQVFNIGADTVYTVKQLAEEIGHVAGVRPEVRFLEERNEVKHAYATHEKVRRILGDVDPVPLSEGLKRMYDWAKQAGPRKSKRFDNIEIIRNLPPVWMQD